MPRKTNQYTKPYRQFQKWFDKQEDVGWPNPAVKQAAEFLLCALWTCSHNHPPSHVATEALAEYIEKLAKAPRLRAVK